MARIFWDASALLKRYFTEAGSPTVDAMFAALLASNMAATLLSISETYAILCRKRNERRISPGNFANAYQSLQREILSHPDVNIISLEDTDVLNSFDMIERHNINSTDALLLTVVLRERAGGDTYALVSSDVRLIRAATADGVSCLNPETNAPDDVPALLAAL